MEVKNELKKEVSFLPNVFKTTDTYDNFLAFAKRLQYLLLMEDGTIPNYTECGVGIKRVLSEPATVELESSIINKIESQVYNFLPNGIIRSTHIKFINSNDNGKPVLVIYFTLNRKVEEYERFAIKFSNDTNNSKVISEIYV